MTHPVTHSISKAPIASTLTRLHPHTHAHTRTHNQHTQDFSSFVDQDTAASGDHRMLSNSSQCGSILMR